MPDSPLYFLLMSLLLVLVCLVAPPVLAARKGYAWYLWTFACGLIGLVVLAFLPFANRPSAGEKVNRSRRQTGNIIGAVLTVVGLMGILFQLMATVLIAGERGLRGTWLSQFGESLMYSSPSLIVYLVGIVLAMIWWQRHPRVSLLAILALGLLFSMNVAASFLFAWMPTYLQQNRGWSFPQTRMLLDAIALLRNCVGAVAFVLLLIALFTDRSPADFSRQMPREREDIEGADIREAERARGAIRGERPS